jgi:hypothetical protein
VTSLPEEHVTVDPLEIVRLRDPHGVLSVYVDADPREQAAARPAWVVAAENGLSEVRERARAADDRAHRTAVFDRLDALEPEIAGLLDARRPGRGRALFATIGADEVLTVSLQMPLPDHVALGEIAHLTPLMVALDRGRPAGLVVVSLAEVQMLEQHLGAVHDVTTIAVDPDTSEWREMKGPAAANPARAQQSAPQRDRFERRLEEHRARLLESAAARLAQVAARHEWDRIVIAGDAHLAQPLAEAVARDAVQVSLVDRTLNGSSPTELADTLAPELEEANRRREASLVSRARDAALAGGPGALGLADVLTALEGGRVDHLLLHEGRRYAGARTADGRLVPADVVPAGVDASELEPTADLTDQIVERALATDARVTPLTDAGAEPLAEHGGIAALLRW